MALRRARLVGLTGLCALALLGPGAGTGGNADARSLAAYTGLGTWIDIYSPSFRADRGVRTLYVETGNFRQRVDVVEPERLAALVEAAHARGIAVVGWYLPDLT